jgi:hypothetical protein
MGKDFGDANGEGDGKGGKVSPPLFGGWGDLGASRGGGREANLD